MEEEKEAFATGFWIGAFAGFISTSALFLIIGLLNH